MNHRIFLVVFAGLLAGQPVAVHAARATSDLQPVQKRQATVATAERLSKRRTPPPLPEDLPSPFNPPGFGKPENEPQPQAAQTGSQ